MLAHVKESPGAYGTESRIEGMLNMAGSVCRPFFFCSVAISILTQKDGMMRIGNRDAALLYCE